VRHLRRTPQISDAPNARNPEHIYGRCALAAFACSAMAVRQKWLGRNLNEYLGMPLGN
jgi:hypothetical protein